MALRWFVMQNQGKLSMKITLDMIDKIPGNNELYFTSTRSYWVARFGIYRSIWWPSNNARWTKLDFYGDHRHNRMEYSSEAFISKAFSARSIGNNWSCSDYFLIFRPIKKFFLRFRLLHSFAIFCLPRGWWDPMIVPLFHNQHCLPLTSTPCGRLGTWPSI